MSIYFTQILNMSLTSSVVILCVMAARLLLKRSPKIFSYALWAVVLFRLLCPVSLPAPVSVLEITKPQTAEIDGISYVAYTPVENVLIESGEIASREQEEPISIKELQERQADNTPSFLDIASGFWLAGIAVMVLYSVVTYLRLYRNLVGAIRWRGNVYLADHITSPFVLGTLFPKIYLPSNTPMKERRYILAHERHHIRRGDHIIKLLAYAALCIHWFNPLVWAAFVLAGKDMEMSCDEAVIKKLGEHTRADYSASLLRLATGRRLITGTPLAFGEGDPKGRIRNMAKWKKPKLWGSIVCLLVCAAVLAACAVNPQNSSQEGKAGEIIYGDLHLPLPEGYTYQENQDNTVSIFYESKVVGGITQWDNPSFALNSGRSEGENNYAEWVAALGLPEAQGDLSITGMIGDANYGNLEAEYWNAQNPEKFDVNHYFYIHGSVVYDIWCDLNLVKTVEMENLLKTAYLEKQAGLPEETTIPAAAETVHQIKEKEPVFSTIQGNSVTYGTMTLTIPEGYDYRKEEDGSLSLLKDGMEIGGITHWPMPDFSASGNMEEWVCALGIPEALEARELNIAQDAGLTNESIAFMISGGGAYMTAWYGKELHLEELNRKHNLFLSFLSDNDFVYDIWFDENQISDIHAEKFLKTVYVDGEATEVTQTDDGADSLAKCKAVLEAVQSGSYHITLLRENRGDAGLQSSYSTEISVNGDDWLSITTILMEGADIPEGTVSSALRSMMYANGKHFAYTGTEWMEIAEDDNFHVPWLAGFQWNEEIISYVDTLTSNGDTVVMLHIDKPWPGLEEHRECYWVDFFFAPDGSFVKAEIQTDYIIEEEDYAYYSFKNTESIVTLDPDTVAAEINMEYQRSIG